MNDIHILKQSKGLCLTHHQHLIQQDSPKLFLAQQKVAGSEQGLLEDHKQWLETKTGTWFWNASSGIPKQTSTYWKGPYGYYLVLF